VIAEEISATGIWVLAQDERGRLIGHGDPQQRRQVGEKVHMVFSMQQTFGFDQATGLTLWAG
jgi:hypothetical protein